MERGEHPLIILLLILILRYALRPSLSYPRATFDALICRMGKREGKEHWSEENLLKRRQPQRGTNSRFRYPSKDRRMNHFPETEAIHFGDF